MLDVIAVAALLGISTRTVLRRVEAGEFPEPRAIGRLKKWPRTQVVAWIEQGQKHNNQA